MTLTRFTTRGLRSEVRSTDGWDYGIDFAASIEGYIEEAEQIVADPDDALRNFNTFRIGKRDAVSYGSYPTILALRLLGSYLKRRYALQTETRETITRGIIQALADSSKMTIHRRDIASFYECIPTAPLKDELLYRDVLPPRARRMLEAFFAAHCEGPLGLPRGLGISAILSEYVMRPADAAVRLLPGVYRYHRFVDDIIVFCIGDAPGLSRSIEATLPSPLALNKRKSSDLDLGKPSGGDARTPSFEYLGYKYSISLDHAAKRPRKVRVSIADRKVNRIRSRLIMAARSYMINSDYGLFFNRINYLTGNYKFQKKRPIASTGKSTVKSGIFYNYRYCGDYQGDTRSSHPMPELRQLDWFLQNSILGRRYPMGRSILGMLTPAQLSRLREMSFAQGHLKRFNSGLSSEQVKSIKSVWKNV